MKRDIASLRDAHFDLLVCGGGVYGAWVAYDAALRGLKVALLEQGDWASATSSASSKLIHGGLRYLETFDFKLVKKALNERGKLLKLAPHRVWPLRFGVPVYGDSRIGRLQLKAGLMLYDWLAHDIGADMRHRYFNRAQFARHFPEISQNGLLGGFSYADAQTDDGRLVLELVAGALDAGAVCINYCQLTALREIGDATNAVSVSDILGGETFGIQSRAVVYATGQWMSGASISRAWCRLSKGVHLILPDMQMEEALLLTARSDGRVFFIIPWYGLTLVGTTDTDYRGDIERVTVKKAEVDYLLQEVNHYLATQWTEHDVLGSYAGVRVLRKNDAASPSSVSRDWELKTTGNGVFYSVGGKITSARVDAAVVVDAVCAKLGKVVPCQTESRLFPWTPKDFSVWSAEIAEQATRLGVDVGSIKWLVRRHGKRADDVLREIERQPFLARRIVPELPLIYADLLFCAREEMVAHLDDLLRRRMPLLILTRLTEDQLGQIAEVVSAALSWDETRVRQEVAAIVARMT